MYAQITTRERQGGVGERGGSGAVGPVVSDDDRGTEGAQGFYRLTLAEETRVVQRRHVHLEIVVGA